MDSHADKVRRFPKSRCGQAPGTAPTKGLKIFLSTFGNPTSPYPKPESFGHPSLRISVLSLFLWNTGAVEIQYPCGHEPPFHICTAALHTPFTVVCGTRVKVRPHSPPTRRHFQFRRIAQLCFRKLVTTASRAHTCTLRAFPLFLVERRVLLVLYLILLPQSTPVARDRTTDPPKVWQQQQVQQRATLMQKPRLSRDAYLFSTHTSSAG